MEEEKANSNLSPAPQEVQINQDTPQSAPISPAKEKMPKKAKRAMWVGIIIVSLVLLFVILFLIAPCIAARMQNCNAFAVGGKDTCHGPFAGWTFLGVIGSITIGAPLAVVGTSLIFYAILCRKKIQGAGLTAFLIALLTTSLLAFLIFFCLTNITPNIG